MLKCPLATETVNEVKYILLSWWEPPSNLETFRMGPITQHYAISLPPTLSPSDKVPLCVEWANSGLPWSVPPAAQVLLCSIQSMLCSHRADRKCSLVASPLVSSMQLSFSLRGARWKLYKRTTGTLWYSSFSLFLKVWIWYKCILSFSVIFHTTVSW